MLPIANELDPLIFRCVCFVCDTNYVFPTIQWVMDSSMVHSCCEDYSVPLVGLCCYSYYSTCRILRKFTKHQRAPNDERALHTEVFTNKVLGRLCEA